MPPRLLEDPPLPWAESGAMPIDLPGVGDPNFGDYDVYEVIERATAAAGHTAPPAQAFSSAASGHGAVGTNGAGHTAFPPQAAASIVSGHGAVGTTGVGHAAHPAQAVMTVQFGHGVALGAGAVSQVNAAALLR